MDDELTALRAEVATLRAEVAALRAQVAAMPQVGFVTACTCGSTAGCKVHPWQYRGNIWVSACAGGAGMQQVTIRPGDPLLNFAVPTAGCAPAVPPLVFSNLGGGWPAV